jgi:hypothetical protein
MGSQFLIREIFRPMTGERFHHTLALQSITSTHITNNQQTVEAAFPPPHPLHHCTRLLLPEKVRPSLAR